MNARLRGRPRDPGVDRAILEIALRLIFSDGYAQMTMDMLLGTYFARYLSGGEFPDEWPEPLLDAVLGGLSSSGPDRLR